MLVNVCMQMYAVRSSQQEVHVGSVGLSPTDHLQTDFQNEVSSEHRQSTQDVPLLHSFVKEIDLLALACCQQPAKHPDTESLSLPNSAMAAMLFNCWIPKVHREKGTIETSRGPFWSYRVTRTSDSAKRDKSSPVLRMKDCVGNLRI